MLKVYLNYGSTPIKSKVKCLGCHLDQKRPLKIPFRLNKTQINLKGYWLSEIAVMIGANYESINVFKNQS